MKNIKNYFVIAFLAIGLSAFAQVSSVDTENSTLKWTGKKVGGDHYGHINIKSGSLKFEKDMIKSGEFTIDMTSITNDDLEGEWNKKLIGHLKSDDFFGVEKHPVSTLEITESGSFKKGEATVKGNLTIKGKTHPIEFLAKKEGNTFTSTIEVDRTLYDVKYGSGKFFDNLGDKAIDDKFTMEVKLVVK
jgi:polyisoprenoid-binding protein YceI